MGQPLFPILRTRQPMPKMGSVRPASPVQSNDQAVDSFNGEGRLQYDYYANSENHAVSRLHEVFLTGMIVCSILTMVSLFQCSSTDTHGWAFFLISAFGVLSYLMPLYLLYVSIIFYKFLKANSQNAEIVVLRLIGASALYLSIDVIFGLGKVGEAINQSFFEARIAAEAWVVVIGLFIASLFLMSNLSFSTLYSFTAKFIKRLFVKRKGAFYPIDANYEDSNQEHYNNSVQREPSLITYEQPFSYPHIHDYQSNQLINCLLNFGIRAVVSNKIPGPVVTRFELYLAPGIKSSSVCAHHKEIARSLCVQEVRVIEVISGKSCVGIEIPNSDREFFTFSELKDEILNTTVKLPLLLGRTITGESKVVNLHTMPHLLIAGSTQSGKTMLLQSLLMSLTTHLSKNDLKIALIDPKQIAFTDWKDAPHLLHPIITDSEEAVSALNWCVQEMERRYKLIARGDHARFPTLVIIVDEFADLIMSHKSEIEEAVKRLAQKARQSDIHLILSTQRPTADVITGHIKTNIPVRIALSVPEKRDSRLILDQEGAQTLLGNGDMLLKTNGQGCERLHAPFVSDREIQEHVSNLIADNCFSIGDKYNQRPNITHIDFKHNQRKDPGDVLYEQVIDFIKETKKASTTGLQNKFKIGYQKAAGIIDRLEADGIIGERIKVNEPREVLIT